MAGLFSSFLTDNPFEPLSLISMLLFLEQELPVRRPVQATRPIFELTLRLQLVLSRAGTQFTLDLAPFLHFYPRQLALL